MSLYSDDCVVCYHFPCVDGLFAALVARQKLKALKSRLRFVPLSTSRPPDVKSLALKDHETVFLLDFASPRSFVENVAKNCRNVIVLDHHLTAWQELNEGPPLASNIELNFDLERCAATLALEYFSPVSIPHRLRPIFELVEDSDLWRMQLADTPAFRSGMNALSINMDVRNNPGVFDRLLSVNYDNVLRNGRRLCSQESNTVDTAVCRAFQVFLGGRNASWGRCLAVEGTEFSRLRSAIGNKLAEESLSLGLRGIGVVAYTDPGNFDGSKIKLSLRSVQSEDTTAITVALGGGGHKCASSCFVDLSTFRQWRA